MTIQDVLYEEATKHATTPKEKALAWAYANGLEVEVQEWAEDFMEQGFKEDEAYRLALAEWDL